MKFIIKSYSFGEFYSSSTAWSKSLDDAVIFSSEDEARRVCDQLSNDNNQSKFIVCKID